MKKKRRDLSLLLSFLSCLFPFLCHIYSPLFPNVRSYIGNMKLSNNVFPEKFFEIIASPKLFFITRMLHNLFKYFSIFLFFSEKISKSSLAVQKQFSFYKLPPQAFNGGYFLDDKMHVAWFIFPVNS